MSKLVFLGVSTDFINFMSSLDCWSSCSRESVKTLKDTVSNDAISTGSRHNAFVPVDPRVAHKKNYVL